MKREPLLILHGWGSNSGRWKKVKELLLEKGIEVLALDLPGFGITPSPPKPWGRDDYINWVLQKVNEKGWKRFNLLGHSFGGGLAAKIATNPSLFKKNEGIEKLILCAPAIIKRRSIKAYLFYWSAVLGKKIFSLPGLKIFYPQAQKLVYKLAGVRDYYVADGMMKETMKKIGKEEDLEGILKKIKIPTLILWGKKDDVLPVKDAYRVKEKIKDSELKILLKVKHSPHREAPEELVEFISQFLPQSE